MYRRTGRPKGLDRSIAAPTIRSQSLPCPGESTRHIPVSQGFSASQSAGAPVSCAVGSPPASAKTCLDLPRQVARSVDEGHGGREAGYCTLGRAPDGGAFWRVVFF